MATNRYVFTPGPRQQLRQRILSPPDDPPRSFTVPCRHSRASQSVFFLSPPLKIKKANGREKSDKGNTHKVQKKRCFSRQTSPALISFHYLPLLHSSPPLSGRAKVIVLPTLVSRGKARTVRVTLSSRKSSLAEWARGWFLPHASPTLSHTALLCGAQALHLTKGW